MTSKWPTYYEFLWIGVHFFLSFQVSEPAFEQKPNLIKLCFWKQFANFFVIERNIITVQFGDFGGFWDKNKSF